MDEFIKDVSGFLGAIDWNEPVLYFILGFHLVFFLFNFLNRHSINMQIFIFLISCVSCWIAEPLNNLLSKNYQYLFQVNYFDAHGIFLSFFWSLPFVFSAIFSLIMILLHVSNLLVQQKRRELAQNMKKKD